MKIFNINADTGINYGNLPDNILGNIEGPSNSTEDGGPSFGVSDRNFVSTKADLTRCASELGHAISFVHQNDLISVIRFTGEPGVNYQTEPQAGPPVNETAEQEQTPPEPEPNTAQNTIETPAAEAPANTAPTQQEQGLVASPEYAPFRPLDRVGTMELIANSMESNITNEAKDLHDKINQFNKDWTEILKRKREIEEATQSVEGNPIINNLISQVSNLRESNNPIEEIYFIEGGFIIVKTGILTTDIELDDNKRVLGRMQFKIDIAPIVGKSSSSDKPIEIVNLDSTYNRGDTSWHCGHVQSSKNGENNICWGQVWNHLFDAIEERNLEALLDVLFRFVKQPDPSDSWGKHAQFFPAAVPTMAGEN